MLGLWAHCARPVTVFMFWSGMALGLVLGSPPRAEAAEAARTETVRVQASDASGGDVATIAGRAEAGDPQAQFQYGTLLYHGLGVVQNWQQAAAWLHKAAAQGHAPANCELGMMYQIGSDGVVRDAARAARFYRAALDAHEPVAALALAGLYAAGEGVEKDTAQAAALLSQAQASGLGGDPSGSAVAELYRRFFDVAAKLAPLPPDAAP